MRLILTVAFLICSGPCICQVIGFSYPDSKKADKYHLPVRAKCAFADGTKKVFFLEDVQNDTLLMWHDEEGKPYRVAWNELRWIRVQRRSTPVLYGLFGFSSAVCATFAFFSANLLSASGPYSGYSHFGATFITLPIAVTAFCTSFSMLAQFPPRHHTADCQVRANAVLK